MHRVIAILVIFGLGGLPAFAQQHSAEFWHLTNVQDPGTKKFSYCAVESGFDNGLYLALARNREMNTNIIVSFSDQRLQAHSKYRMLVGIDSFPVRDVVGFSADAATLVIPLQHDRKIIEWLGKGKMLELKGPEDSVKFALDGASTALRDLQMCVETQLKTEAEQSDGTPDARPQVAEGPLASSTVPGVGDMVEPLPLANQSASGHAGGAPHAAMAGNDESESAPPEPTPTQKAAPEPPASASALADIAGPKGNEPASSPPELVVQTETPLPQPATVGQPDASQVASPQSAPGKTLDHIPVMRTDAVTQTVPSVAATVPAAAQSTPPTAAPQTADDAVATTNKEAAAMALARLHAQIEDKQAAEAKAKADADVKAAAQAKAVTDAKAAAQAKADAKAKAASQAQADADAKAAAQAQAEEDAKVAAQAKADAAAKAVATAKAAAAAKSAAQAKADEDARIAAKADADAKAEATAKAAAEVKAAAEAKAEEDARTARQAKLDAAAQAAAQAKADADVKAAAQAKADARAAQQARLYAEVQAAEQRRLEAAAKAEADKKAAAQAQTDADAVRKAQAASAKAAPQVAMVLDSSPAVKAAPPASPPKLMAAPAAQDGVTPAKAPAIALQAPVVHATTPPQRGEAVLQSNSPYAVSTPRYDTQVAILDGVPSEGEEPMVGSASISLDGHSPAQAAHAPRAVGPLGSLLRQTGIAVALPPGKTPTNYSWTGDGIVGTAMEVRIHKPFIDAMLDDIDRREKQCKGQFSSSIGTPTEIGGITYSEVATGCGAGKGTAGILLYYVRDGRFGAVSQETSGPLQAAAMQIRDRIESQLQSEANSR